MQKLQSANKKCSNTSPAGGMGCALYAHGTGWRRRGKAGRVGPLLRLLRLRRLDDEDGCCLARGAAAAHAAVAAARAAAKNDADDDEREGDQPADDAADDGAGEVGCAHVED